MDLVLARVWRGGQAVGIAPTERLNLRRQMAAATGKNESVSLSLFVDINYFEGRRGLIHHGHSFFWAEG